MKIKGSGFVNALRDQLRVVIVFTILLAGFTGWLWWDRIVKNPSNVFDRMLANSLRTTSYGRLSEQSDGIQSLTINSLSSLAPFHRIHSINTLSQGESTRIVTENLSDNSVNYVRYKSIQTQEKRQSGQDFDFSNVIGIWGRQDARLGENGPAQIYTQNVLLPLVNLPPQERSDLLNQIRNDKVYDADFSKVKQETRNGRLVYVYPTTINPVPYISMIKSIAGIYGLSNLDNIDPKQYENVPPLEFEFVIDVLSAQVTAINYINDSRSEIFTGYGAVDGVNLPENTVPLEELQQRLQQQQ